MATKRVSEKRLTLDNLRVGMVVAADIVDPKTKEIIVAANTTIDVESLVKLKTFYFSEAEAKGHTIYEPTITVDDISKDTIVHLTEGDKESFDNFKNIYEQSYQKTKEILSGISEGIIPGKEVIIHTIDDIFATTRYKSDVFMCLNYLKTQPEYLTDHIISVSLICKIIADWMELSPAEGQTLVMAAFLHDVGMNKVAALSMKQTKLSDGEFAKVMLHPIHSYNLVKDMEISNDVKYAILQHHERIDGSGYPNHLVDSQINRFAKMLSVADLFSAMIADRPYRDKLVPFETLRQFERDYLGKLDTEVLLTFLENIAYEYVGREAKLSDGSIAKIVFINRAQPSSPIVRVKATGDCIDLMYNKYVSIVDIY
ncbi:HD family phosphohydrolase [Clostridia bacterium]|nr:HD family phosphohydrolase [Clostridia bacterium]GHU74640.1 HD family phosphohydrolase [Clostridia bacterium]